MQKVQNELRLFEELNAVPVLRHNIILIPADRALITAKGLLNRSSTILGFDSFTVFENKTIEPSMEFSPDYSNILPDFDRIKQDIQKAPKYITYFEFVITID